jgi:hypothetical protein
MQRPVLSAGVMKDLDDAGLSLCSAACPGELGSCEVGIGDVADHVCSADIGILPGLRRPTHSTITGYRIMAF